MSRLSNLKAKVELARQKGDINPFLLSRIIEVEEREGETKAEIVKIKDEIDIVQPISVDKFEPIKEETILRALRFELYLTTLHMTEALFGWIHSIEKNPKYPVINLTTYKVGDLKNIANEIVTGKRVFTKEGIARIVYGLTKLQASMKCFCVTLSFLFEILMRAAFNTAFLIWPPENSYLLAKS